MSDRPTPETDAECPYCKAMPMGMIAKVRWTCGSYGGPTGRSERCKERANAWEQRDVALRERDEAREELRQWQTLRSWGGTPEHIHDFINGQQSRIHEVQDIEKTCEQLERERDEARGKTASWIREWREMRELWRGLGRAANNLMRELEEARERNAKLVSIAERAIDDLRWFYEGKADGIILELDQLKVVAK